MNGTATEDCEIAKITPKTMNTMKIGISHHNLLDQRKSNKPFKIDSLKTKGFIRSGNFFKISFSFNKKTRSRKTHCAENGGLAFKI